MKQSNLLRKATLSRPRAATSPAPRLAAVVEDSPKTGDADDIGEDIILDMLRRFAACVQIHAEKFEALEREMRIEWGGLRPYVPRERGRGEVSRRNARIFEESQRGEHIALLSRRWGLKIDTVRRIIDKERERTLRLIHP